MSTSQPKTGAKCECRQGVERDNCPRCEGTGMVIDFKAIREKPQQPAEGAQFTPGPWHVEKCSAPVYGSDGTLMVNGVGIGAGSRHIGTISSKNAHNDANLIAAAPAMYEALSMAHNVLYMLKQGFPSEALCSENNPWGQDTGTLPDGKKVSRSAYMKKADEATAVALSQAEGR